MFNTTHANTAAAAAVEVAAMMARLGTILADLQEVQVSDRETELAAMEANNDLTTALDMLEEVALYARSASNALMCIETDI